MARILTVCTGNICRSPAAALMLQGALGPEIEVASAGTQALSGQPIPPLMLAELDKDGIDGRSHRAQRLSADLAYSADLVITMTRVHRQYTTHLEPAALHRTFTLAEVAAVCRTAPAHPAAMLETRVMDLPRLVRGRRHHFAGYALDDIPDPYHRPESVYHESYGMIREALDSVLAWLRAGVHAESTLRAE